MEWLQASRDSWKPKGEHPRGCTNALQGVSKIKRLMAVWCSHFPPSPTSWKVQHELSISHFIHPKDDDQNAHDVLPIEIKQRCRHLLIFYSKGARRPFLTHNLFFNQATSSADLFFILQWECGGGVGWITTDAYMQMAFYSCTVHPVSQSSKIVHVRVTSELELR